MNRRQLYTLLTSLYTTQFIGSGFLLVGMVGVLRESGISLQTLGALQTLGILWGLKFLWAPLLDRFGGRRTGHYRLWLLVLQSGMVISLLLMLGIRPGLEHLTAFIALATAFVLFSATQDIAADAVAVRLVDREHRGIANGIQVMGGYLGSILGGGVTVVIYDQFGWIPAVIVLSVMTATGLVVVMMFRETPHLRHEPPPNLAQAYRALGSVLAQPHAKRWALVVLPLLFIGIGGVNALTTPALKDHGWSLTQIGFITTIVAAVPAALGGLLGGWMIRRFGKTVPLVTGCVALAVATAMQLPMFAGIRIDALTTVGVCLFLAAYALPSAVICATAMDFSREPTAGTDYTMLSSIAMALSFVAAAAALYAAAAFGYVAAAIGSTVIFAVGTVLAIGFFSRHDREQAAHTDPNALCEAPLSGADQGGADQSRASQGGAAQASIATATR